MKVAVVTLTLTLPADPSVVASRELNFSPAPIDPPNPRVVAADAATVDGLRFPLGASVSGTLTDVSPSGARSQPVNFHIDATPPVPVPTAPTVASVAEADVPDVAPPATPTT